MIETKLVWKMIIIFLLFGLIAFLSNNTPTMFDSDQELFFFYSCMAFILILALLFSIPLIQKAFKQL